MPLKKIVIIGPESTGKSTLCEGLAAHFNAGAQATVHSLPIPEVHSGTIPEVHSRTGGPADWVPEFARQYLLTHGMKYVYEDLLTIARGQIALEDEKAAALTQLAGIAAPKSLSSNASPDDRIPADPILFVDTDLYVMKVWSEFVYGRCDPWILGQIGSRKYDGYLLCRTDLPWVKDELREYPDLVTREKLFRIYRDLLANQPTPWEEISGQADQRLENAIAATRKLIG
jgi:nicotinamide riboside kinase